MLILEKIELKYKGSIAALEAFAFLFLILQFSFFTGCAHTVDYQAVHDTSTVLHHDTIPGPTFIRFLAMLNNNKTSGIITLKTDSLQNKNLFTDVNPQMRKEFIPIPQDSTFVLYASYFFGTGTQKFDSLTIPSFKSYTMHTVVLFRTNDLTDPNRLFPVFADDSLRKMIAPKDSCYIRLINGLPDYPQPTPLVNLYLDDINAAPFFKDNTNGSPLPVSFQEIRNYTLMPAGSHQLFVRSQGDVTQSYSVSQQFVPGGFYTIRLTGTKADGTDQLSIDPE